MTPLVLFHKKGRMLALLLGAILLIVCSCAIATAPRFHDRFEVRLVGIVGVVFFGAGSIWILLRLLSKRPALLLDERGVTDQATGAAAGFIAWEQISHVEIMRFPLGTRFLAIYLREGERLHTARRGIISGLLSANASLTGTPVNIPDGLEMELETLRGELQRRLAEHRGRTSSGAASSAT